MNAHAVAPPVRWVRWSSGYVLAVVVVGVLVQLDVWEPMSFVTPERHRPVLSAVFAAISLALLWRRRAPLAVLAFVYTALALLYLAIGAPEALGTFLPPLVALYAVGRYADARSLVLAGPIVLLGTALHEVEDPAFTLSGPALVYWALLAAAWPLGRAFRRRALAEVTLAARAEMAQRRSEAEARAAAVGERARIARELHDVVGHGLSVVVLQLVAAVAVLDHADAGAVRERLLAAERSARDALAEMRRLLGLLDDDEGASLTPQPGLDQLERLVADSRAVGAEIELAIAGTARDLPAGIDLAAFRIVQESLTNVLRHARPPVARVCVAYEPDAIVLQVRDTGRTAAWGAPGRGVAGMRERAALYGGELEIGPQPGGGFLVRARLPVPT